MLEVIISGSVRLLPLLTLKLPVRPVLLLTHFTDGRQ